jgi:hypothetical protein
VKKRCNIYTKKKIREGGPKPTSLLLKKKKKTKYSLNRFELEKETNYLNLSHHVDQSQNEYLLT